MFHLCGEVPLQWSVLDGGARAYTHYGKGRHAARLNFGDCLSYAAAKLAAQPLLYVGEDSPKTDLHPLSSVITRLATRLSKRNC